MSTDPDVDPPKERRRHGRQFTPTQQALALLVRREHSGKELARKLLARGINRQDAQAAIERLSGEGWQSDARFAEMLVRTRASHGYGPVRICAELGIHGIDGSGVEKAMAGFDGDWLAMAKDLVMRRFGVALEGDLAQRRKAAEFLYRRGFDADMVRLALCAGEGD
ncbi:MAG TPA: regulatory protein RecX [Pseudoxanthomonas sp.]|nr:regulatory protein RecX [Pseudoxanthomonas sp.]